MNAGGRHGVFRAQAGHEARSDRQVLFVLSFNFTHLDIGRDPAQVQESVSGSRERVHDRVQEIMNEAGDV